MKAKSTIITSIFSYLILLSLIIPQIAKTEETLTDQEKNKLEKARAYIDSGINKKKRNDFNGAIDDFNKVIELKLNNNNVNKAAYGNRGLALFSLNNFKGAIDDFNKAIDLGHDSSDFGIYKKRGQAKANLKDYKGALDDFNKSIELNALHETYFFRGSVKANLKDYNGAIQDYTKAIESAKDEPNYLAESYFYRAMTKKWAKDYQGAIEDFTKVTQLLPNYHVAYSAIAQVKTELKDYTGAIKYYNKSIEIEKKGEDPSLYFKRGEVKFILQDNIGACSDWKQAAKLGYKKANKMIQKNCK